MNGPVLALFAILASMGAQPARMAFTTIARGQQSRIEEPRQVVVRTTAQWTTLWKEHTGTPNPPAVDFSRSMVIGVFAGSRPTAGYAVEIVAIEKQGAGLVVTYREHAPARDEIVAQVLTSPFDIVRTESDGGPIRFQRAR